LTDPVIASGESRCWPASAAAVGVSHTEKLTQKYTSLASTRLSSKRYVALTGTFCTTLRVNDRLVPSPRSTNTPGALRRCEKTPTPSVLRGSRNQRRRTSAPIW
jgi:hypothetical protein